MKDSIVLEEPFSSATYGGGGGGRAIDRHNPIIRDEKRLGKGRILPSNSTITVTSPTAPDRHHQNLTPPAEGGDQKRKSIAFADGDDDGGDGFISPVSSSRCLLGDRSIFNFSSEFHHVLPPSPPLEPLEFQNGIRSKKDDSLAFTPPTPPSPPPCERLRFRNDDDDDPPSSSPPKPPPLPPSEPPKYLHTFKASNKKHHDPLSSTTPKPPSPPPPPPSSDKVVVLEVSLHCRGCERKMKKHISRMEGVTSFKIEFASKKVTVVGDVTPLAVLTSVLKVKNAKLLTPAIISSSSSQIGSIPK